MKADASPKKSGEARPKARDPQQTRARLVEAAARIFNEHGYYGTDTNRIAVSAGYAAGTFYKHFADKREVFLEAYDGWVQSEWVEIEQAVASSGERDEIVERIVKAVLAHHRRWAKFRASLVSLAVSDEQVFDFRIVRRRRQMRLFAQVMHRLGAPRPEPARTMLVLMAFERVCDAVALGEAKALGVSQKAVVAELKELLLVDVRDR